MDIAKQRIKIFHEQKQPIKLRKSKKGDNIHVAISLHPFDATNLSMWIMHCYFVFLAYKQTTNQSFKMMNYLGHVCWNGCSKL